MTSSRGEVDLAAVIAAAKSERVRRLEAERREKEEELQAEKLKIAEWIDAAILNGADHVGLGAISFEAVTWVRKSGCWVVDESDVLSSSKHWVVYFPE